MSEEHVEKQSDDVLDIGDLAAEHTAEMVVLHPKTSVPTTWVWTLAGPGHPKTLEIQNKLGVRERTENFHNEKAMRSGRAPKILTNPEVVDINVPRYSARVLHFTPVKLNGRLLEFSPEEAHGLLKDPNYSWLWAQVYNFVNAEDAFIKASPTT